MICVIKKHNVTVTTCYITMSCYLTVPVIHILSDRADMTVH